MKKSILSGVIIHINSDTFGTPVAIVSDGQSVRVMSTDKTLESELMRVLDGPMAKDKQKEMGEKFDPVAYLSRTVGQNFVFDIDPFSAEKVAEIESYFNGEGNGSGTAK